MASASGLAVLGDAEPGQASGRTPEGSLDGEQLRRHFLVVGGCCSLSVEGYPVGQLIEDRGEGGQLCVALGHQPILTLLERDPNPEPGLPNPEPGLPDPTTRAVTPEPKPGSPGLSSTRCRKTGPEPVSTDRDCRPAEYH